MHFCFVMLKNLKFSNINWDFTQKPPIIRVEKNVYPIYTLGNIKIHKIESLGTLKIKLEFIMGVAWEPYLAPRLIGAINGIWMYIIIFAQNPPQGEPLYAYQCS